MVSSQKINISRLPLGSLCQTPGAAAIGVDFRPYLVRHMRGDWGEVCPEDAAENEFSVQNGFRILSAYRLACGKRIYIITEADRSRTTVLLPEEY